MGLETQVPGNAEDCRDAARRLRWLANKVDECRPFLRRQAGLPDDEWSGLTADCYRSACRRHHRVFTNISENVRGASAGLDDFAGNLDQVNRVMARAREVARGEFALRGTTIVPPPAYTTPQQQATYQRLKILTDGAWQVYRLAVQQLRGVMHASDVGPLVPGAPLPGVPLAPPGWRKLPDATRPDWPPSEVDWPGATPMTPPPGSAPGPAVEPPAAPPPGPGSPPPPSPAPPTGGHPGGVLAGPDRPDRTTDLDTPWSDPDGRQPDPRTGLLLPGDLPDDLTVIDWSPGTDLPDGPALLDLPRGEQQPEEPTFVVSPSGDTYALVPLSAGFAPADLLAVPIGPWGELS